MPDNNRIEQDHRRIKRRVRPMMGFKHEMVHMMRQRRDRFPFNPAPSLKEQFEAIDG
jgi:transposase-like protein